MKVTREILSSLESQIFNIFGVFPIFCGSTALVLAELLDREVKDIDIIIPYIDDNQLHYLQGALSAVSKVCVARKASSCKESLVHNSFSVQYNNESITVDVWLYCLPTISVESIGNFRVERLEAILREKLNIGRPKDYADLNYMLHKDPTKTMSLLKKLEG